MNRLNTVIMTVVLVLATVAAVPAAGTAQETTASNASNASVAPGELLTGVVGVQGAEFEGEVERRTFGLRVAQAASDEDRADIVAEELEDQEGKLADLEARKDALEEARANGSISNGTYRAQVAILAAETQNVKTMGNATRNASENLPADLLESKGINATAIQTLMDGAEELTGPEVAEIARSIAGPDVGQSIADDHSPVTVGPPDDVGPSDSQADGNATDQADGTETDTSRPSSPGEGGAPSGGQGNGGY